MNMALCKKLEQVAISDGADPMPNALYPKRMNTLPDILWRPIFASMSCCPQPLGFGLAVEGLIIGRSKSLLLTRKANPCNRKFGTRGKDLLIDPCSCLHTMIALDIDEKLYPVGNAMSRQCLCHHIHHCLEAQSSV